MLFCRPWLQPVVTWAVAFLWSPSPDMNHLFSSTQLQHFGYFLFLVLFSVNLCKCIMWWKSQEIRTVKPACLAPTVIFTTLKINLFFSYSDADFELQWVVINRSAWINALSCCHVFGWFVIWVKKSFNILHRKVASGRICLQAAVSFGVFQLRDGSRWDWKARPEGEIPGLGGEMSEIHLWIKEQSLEKKCWSHVRAEVTCLWEFDIDIKFSRFCATSPFLCYDTHHWFIVLWSKAMTYYTENYRYNCILVSVSNRVTISVISKHLCTELMACECTSENVALLNWCFFNKHRPLGTWVEILGEFSLSTTAQESRGLITRAQSSASPRSRGLCDLRLWEETSPPIAKTIHS